MLRSGCIQRLYDVFSQHLAKVVFNERYYHDQYLSVVRCKLQLLALFDVIAMDIVYADCTPVPLTLQYFQFILN